MQIEGIDIPLTFDGRKMFLKICKPTTTDLRTMEIFELTSPLPFEPEKVYTPRRQNIQPLPWNLSIGEWSKRLALAPQDVIRKTMDATTQMAMRVEAESRIDPRRHRISRFPFLREKRLNDEFHTDTFFPSVVTSKKETCSQIFLGKKTDYMDVYPLKTESHAFTALQDFGKDIGIPHTIKSDNSQTETGHQWTEWCRKYCSRHITTEPHHPWQNISEQGVGDLSRMVRRCMREFNAPLSRHGWCQKWCAEVRNHLESRKLKWRTPIEKLNGNTPDISQFRFHFWEPIWYHDPTVKTPRDTLRKGRFLGIATSAGDSLTFYIETERPKSEGRREVLIRSNVRSRRTNIGSSSEHVQEETPMNALPSIDLDFSQEHPTLPPTEHEAPMYEKLSENMRLNMVNYAWKRYLQRLEITRKRINHHYWEKRIFEDTNNSLVWPSG